MRKIKTVSYEEIEKEIGMPMEFWERTSSLTPDEQKSLIRQELESSWNTEFLSIMKKKSLEEQMNYFRIETESHYTKTGYGKNTKSNVSHSDYSLKDYEGLNALIVEDGAIIGVCIDAFGGHNSLGKPAFPNHNVCTYYASDDNGSGSSEREEYAQLCLVMPE